MKMASSSSSTTTPPPQSSLTTATTASNQQQQYLLSPREITQLKDILASQASLDSISATVQKTFGAKTQRFRLCCAIAVLLSEDHLPRPSRIAAFYVLVDQYKHDNTIHPFLRVFLDAVEHNVGGSTERAFIVHLINAPASNKDIGKKSPTDITKEFSSPLTASNTAMKGWLDEYNARLPRVRDALHACAIRPAVLKSRNTGSSSSQQPLIPTMDETSLLGVEPEFSRLPPPLFFPDDDLAWMSPIAMPGFLFDDAMGEDTNGSEEIRSLMTLALEGPINQEQAKSIKMLLDKDSTIIHKSGLNNSNLPRLVENNPAVAIEALMKLVDSSQFPEFLSALVNMEMSLESMDVVNRLTTTVQLPTEFLHLYISNCISSCENMKDKQIQNRNVRIVCVFLQSLIRNNIVRVQDIYLEVQAFCIEFSKIREAAGLFKLLGTALSNSSSTNSSVASTSSSSGGGGGNNNSGMGGGNLSLGGSGLNMGNIING
jgi:hypothetical protein